MKNKTPKHTRFRKNTKVILTFVDGTKKVDKYVEITGNGRIKFEESGWLRKNDLLSINFYDKYKANQ